MSRRSTCYRRNVGAVLSERGIITATGYNGNPSGEGHCNIGECPRDGMEPGEHLELCTAVHADMNALLRGDGDTLYIYGGSPCNNCVSAIINKGIKRVVYIGDYPHKQAIERLVRAKIIVEGGK